ncbi:MAG: hypothetical protein AAF665_11255 [Pseudomonadota bacterium]
MHIVIGLIVAFVLVGLYARQHRGVRGCRWRADHTGDRGALRKYRCAACGAETFSAGKQPPRECSRDLL